LRSRPRRILSWLVRRFFYTSTAVLVSILTGTVCVIYALSYCSAFHS